MVCFSACGIWCLADVSSVSPSSEQTEYELCNGPNIDSEDDFHTGCRKHQSQTNKQSFSGLHQTRTINQTQTRLTLVTTNNGPSPDYSNPDDHLQPTINIDSPGSQPTTVLRTTPTRTINQTQARLTLVTTNNGPSPDYSNPDDHLQPTTNIDSPGSQPTTVLRTTPSRTINQTQTRLTLVTTNNSPSPDYSNPDDHLQPTINIDSPGSQPTTVLRTTPSRTINQTQTRLTLVTTNNGPSPDYSNPDDHLQPTINIDSPGSQPTTVLRTTPTRTINQTQARLTLVTTNNGPSPDYSNPDDHLQPTTNIDSPGSQPTTVLRTTPTRTINQTQAYSTL